MRDSELRVGMKIQLNKKGRVQYTKDAYFPTWMNGEHIILEIKDNGKDSNFKDEGCTRYVITDKAHAGIYAIFIEEVQNSPFNIEIVESK